MSKRLSVALSDEEMSALDKLLTGLGRTKSEFVRSAILDAMALYEIYADLGKAEENWRKARGL